MSKKEILGCGILGCHHIQVADDRFRLMLDTMAHRGPDDEGVWKSDDNRTVFGHRRLSIIGIDKRGTQPMVREAFKLTITYNGELYNYLYLKKELQNIGYVFTSETDTEVILFAYKEWGKSCLLKFNGIFAFAIFDGNNDTIFMARDHLGVKPFVYTRHNKGLLFASEAKVILKHPSITVNPNFYAIRSTWIHHLWQDNHETWFENIHNLEPGCYMVLNRKNNEISKHRYWGIDSNLENSCSYDKSKIMFKDLIWNAVEIQLASDVGFSATLSGGLDSATIASIIAQLQNDSKVDVFSIKYESDEVLPEINSTAPEFTNGYTRRTVDYWHSLKLSKHFSNLNLIDVDVTRQDYQNKIIDNMVFGLEQIPFDSRMLSLYKLYEKIKQHNHKVTLIGQGPDEVWLGYYYDDDFWRLSPEFLSKEYLCDEYYPTQISLPYEAWNESFLTKQKVIENSRINLDRNYNCNFRDPLHNLSYLGMNTILQSILHTEDRVSMIHSIEARVPWVDYRLMKLAFEVPSYQKINAPDDNKAKFFNREALKGVVPDFILNRRKSPLPHPPSEYRNKVVKSLIIPNMEQMKKSAFLDEIFNKNFIANLPEDSEVTHNEMFKIFCMWKFEKLFNI